MNRKTALIFTLFIIYFTVLSPALPAGAQEEMTTEVTSEVVSGASPVIKDGEYRLNVDDIIGVYIWRHPEVSTGSSLQQGALGTGLQVAPDGYITYPFIGKLNVTGMTTEDVRRKILEALKDIYRSPVATVSIIKRRMFRLYMLGEVQKPGLYDMEKPEITLKEAIAIAGGLKEKAAVARATLQRGDEVLPLDLTGMAYRGESGPPIKVRPEDRITIPDQRKRVAVLGEVQKQGLYDIRDEHTVLDAIALAGGYNDRAKPDKVAILRRNGAKFEVIPINTRALFGNILKSDSDKFKGRMVTTQANMQKETLGKNIQLEDRDIIYVPMLNTVRWSDLVQGGTFLYYVRLIFPNP